MPALSDDWVALMARGDVEGLTGFLPGSFTVLATITPGSGVAWLYAGFVLLVFVFLALDLGVLNRHAHVISMREALRWTVPWVSCALVFTIAVYFIYERQWLGMGRDVRQLGGTLRDVGGLGRGRGMHHEVPHLPLRSRLAFSVQVHVDDLREALPRREVERTA